MSVPRRKPLSINTGIPPPTALDDLREGVDRRAARVAEAAAMVRDDDRVDAGLAGQHGILVRQDALQQQFPLYRVPQVLDEIPIHVRRAEAGRAGEIDPVEIGPARDVLRQAPAMAIGAVPGVAAPQPR